MASRSLECRRCHSANIAILTSIGLNGGLCATPTGVNGVYWIRSIKYRSYYLFHRPSLCGVYSRAATIQERRLLIPVAAREAILRETVDRYR